MSEYSIGSEPLIKHREITRKKANPVGKAALQVAGLGAGIYIADKFIKSRNVEPPKPGIITKILAPIKKIGGNNQTVKTITEHIEQLPAKSKSWFSKLPPIGKIAFAAGTALIGIKAILDTKKAEKEEAKEGGESPAGEAKGEEEAKLPPSNLKEYSMFNDPFMKEAAKIEQSSPAGWAAPFEIMKLAKEGPEGKSEGKGE